MSSPLPSYVKLPEPVASHPQQTTPLPPPAQASVPSKEISNACWAGIMITSCACLIIVASVMFVTLVLLLPFNSNVNGLIAFGSLLALIFIAVIIVFAVVIGRHYHRRGSIASNV